jgi:hypothetical protein
VILDKEALTCAFLSRAFLAKATYTLFIRPINGTAMNLNSIFKLFIAVGFSQWIKSINERGL